jgi:ADP-ribose pyrophosphatase
MIEDKATQAPVIHDVTLSHDGPRPMETISLTPPDGGPKQTRDVVRAGKVAAVIAYDPEADALVMLRQFRLAAHLANGKGELVEIVAGRVEEDEDITLAAIRECEEEIGVTPVGLEALFTFLPSPGYTDEETTVFLGRVRVGEVPETAGALDEGESTLPFVISRESAIAALNSGRIHNGLTLVALGWVARNLTRLKSVSNT